jgi:integrase
LEKNRITNLTRERIRDHSYTGGRGILWDAKVTGFGVRAYASGKKAYVLSYRAEGRKRLLTLAPVTVLTLDEARKRAVGELGKISAGADPIVERTRQEKVEIFRELCARYIANHAKPRKKTWQADQRRIDQHVPGTWKALPAAAVNKRMLKDRHAEIGAMYPYEANRFLSLMSKVFAFADIEPNPAKGIERFKEKSRKRFALAEEVKALTIAIDTEPSVYVRGALWLYLLTGARKSELLERRRSELDERRRGFVLPDSKSGEEQFIPLTPPAMAIVKALPKMEGNPYVFPGRKHGQHLVNITKPWQRVKAKAGIEDLRLHDLRRTVGSWLAQGGVDLATIRDTLRHKSIATTLVYARLGADPGREALEKHGDAVTALAGRMRVVG